MSETPQTSEWETGHSPEEEYDPTKEFGYKRGIIAVYIEILIAVGVTLFSLYVALTGAGGFPGK